LCPSEFFVNGCRRIWLNGFSPRYLMDARPSTPPGGSGCFREVAELAEAYPLARRRKRTLVSQLAEDAVGGTIPQPQEPMPSFSSLFAFCQAIFSYAA